MNPPALDPEWARPAATAARRILSSPLTRYQLRAAAQMSEPGDVPDTYRYPVVVFLWPRQTGKTTTILCAAVGRGLLQPDYRAAYAAQTGHITSQRFKEWTDLIRRHPGWAQTFKTRDSDGTERITVRATGSYLRAFPPIPGRLRSAALDLVVVDEAQEHPDSIGAKLDSDIQPTMDTRPRGQRIIAGTAGDLSATYFRRHYRAAVDGAPGYLLLELGTPPDDVDLDDPAVWAAHHPGVRSGRTTLDKLRAAYTALGPDRFHREYLNRWTEALVESVFPGGAWRACHDPAATIDVDAGAPVELAVEVPPDRDSAVIVAAGPSTAGPDRWHVEHVDALPLPLLPARLSALTRRYRTPAIVDPMGPAANLIPTLRRAGVPVHEPPPVEFITAALNLYDLVADHRLTHLDQPTLSSAAAGATKRKVGNRWTFDRHAPGGPLLVAAALASWRAVSRAGHARPHVEAG